MSQPTRLKEIRPGSGGSNPSLYGAVVLGGQLLFTADDGVSGEELWSTDGTPGGTRLLKDGNPGPATSYPSNLTLSANRVFFTAEDDANGRELWSTDGTPAGTGLVKDIRPGIFAPGFPQGSNPDYLTPFANQLVFTASNGNSGTELWVSDGTASGTRLLKDINPGNYRGGDPAELKVVGDQLLFWADDDVSGQELWRTDSSLQTTLVKNINPGVGNGLDSGSFLYVMQTAAGARLLFQADDGAKGQELWITDGTAAGTSLLKDVTPGAPGTYISPRNVTPVGNKLFFLADSSSVSPALWRTDGTPEGTGQIKPFADGSTRFTYSLSALPSGKLLINRINRRQATHELWLSDGTSAGTTLLRRINPGNGGGGGSGSYTYSIGTVVGNKLFFTANDGSSGNELWVSDGSAAGTRLVKNIRPGGAGSAPTKLTAVGNQVVFWANDGLTGEELWISDGTAAGTRQLADLNPGSGSATKASTSQGGSGSFDYTIKVLADTLIFSGNDGSGGAELWALKISGPPPPPPPVLSIAALAASKAEGSGPAATPFTFRVSRSGDLAGVSTAVWGVAGVGPAAADGADFSGGSFPGGTVSFAAGEASKTLTVAVAADGVVEANETFKLTLSSPTGAALGTATATGTIVNDDTTLAITSLSAAKGEGRTGSTPFTYTVTRGGLLTGRSSAVWSVAGSGAVPAEVSDFIGATRGTVSFAAGQASRTITVAVRGDLAQEGDETFSLTLSAATGATLGSATATGTIFNDDLIGDATANTLVGTDRPDWIDGRGNGTSPPAGDILTGGGAADIFAFRFGESPLTAADTITDFAFGADKMDLFSPTGGALSAPRSFSRAATNSTATTLGALAAAVFTDANGALRGNQALAANGAVLVQATNPTIAGTYLLINNGVASRSDTDDLLIKLGGALPGLPAVGVPGVASVFV